MEDETLYENDTIKNEEVVTEADSAATSIESSMDEKSKSETTFEETSADEIKTESESLSADGENAESESVSVETSEEADNQWSISKTMNSIGWKYGLMGITYIAVELGLGKLLPFLFPNFAEKYSVYLTFALMVFTVDMVCFPLIWLLTRNMPKAKLKKNKLGFGRFILCIMIMYGLVGLGVIIGSIFHLPLTLPFSDSTENKLNMLLMGSNPFVRIFVVGILAPIFEELIFRKVLVDHVAPKGELVAIIASGLMFGLFHGNFQQGFFAAFIGCMFAYVYLKTGKVIYTILFHMFLNCVTSGITVGLIQWVYKVAEDNHINLEEVSESMEYSQSSFDAMTKLLIPSSVMILWVLALLLFMFIGFITFIVVLCLKKVKIERKETDDSFGKQFLAIVASPCMWIFYLVCFFLFVYNYLPPIISSLIK